VGAVLGHVRAPDGGGVLAVVTLVDPDGREADRAVTAADGSFRLGPPHAGDYVLVATPRDGAATAYGPQADRVAVDGGPRSLDLVLTPRSVAPLPTAT
jgi:hypothetical protein